MPTFSVSAVDERLCGRRWSRLHRLLAFAIVCICWNASHVMGADTTVLRAESFGAVAEDAKDDTEAFQRMFAAAAVASGPVTLELSRGQYDFHPEKATRRVCFASNAVDSDRPERTIGLYLNGLSDITIRGDGTMLMMHGNMSLLVAEQCYRLTIEKVSFDLARPTVSEITVTAVGENYWIGKAHNDTPFVMENGRPVWVGEGWRNSATLAQRFDLETERTWREAEPFGRATGVLETSPGELTLTVPKRPAYKVGQVITVRDTKRDQVGMWFNHCSALTLRDVNVHALAGFGVVSQFTESITFERVRVEPAVGSGRVCVSAADVFHFSMCRGKIVLRQCVMKGAQDDAVNVHGIHFKIVRRLADNRVAVAFGHPQTRGFESFWPGDEVKFTARDTLRPLGRAKVTAVAFRDDVHELTLDAPVPASVNVGRDVIENMTWSPSVTITGCRIERIPTRGLLLTTRGPIVVDKNYFGRTTMPAILISDDASSWFESGPVRDVTIRDNTFFHCGEPVVDVHPENRVDAGPVHQNIRVIGNQFVFEKQAVSVKSALDVLVTGNRFESASEQSRSAAGAVASKGSVQLVVRDNTMATRQE